MHTHTLTHTLIRTNKDIHTLTSSMQLQDRRGGRSLQTAICLVGTASSVKPKLNDLELNIQAI
jgi:hypothetical protein